MSTIKPHGLFTVWSPDQVAECLDGISDLLYRKLWGELVPLYDKEPRSQFNDDFNRRCLAKFWDRLSEQEQRQLNALARLHEEKYRRGVSHHAQ